MIPKIEDGNNFGVSVQEKVYEEVCRIQKFGFSSLEQFAQYHEKRSKIISLGIKFNSIVSVTKNRGTFMNV